MDETMMPVYLTKFALDATIIKRTLATEQYRLIDADTLSISSHGGTRVRIFRGLGLEWHRSYESARRAAEHQRLELIRQLAVMKFLDFEPSHCVP